MANRVLLYLLLNHALLSCANQSQLRLETLSLSHMASLYTPQSNFSDIDIATGSMSAGLTTFANLPHLNCFLNDTKYEPYDIAFVGAPFDTAVSARPGARYGPAGIRKGSQRINADFNYDILTGRNPFKDWATIIDCGDVPMTVFDNRYALLQLEKGHRLVSSRPSAVNEKHVPRIVTLGGDHTVTLAALRSAFSHWGQLTVIHFDSHIDTWDPKVLGGGISDYSAVNHGTFLHVAHEEGLILNKSVHVGIRAPGARPKDDRRNDLRCGFEIITSREIDKVGVQGVISKLRDRIGDGPIYISVDIDVLDPAFAPATGTPEVAGWTTRELLSILEGLSGLYIVGGDVVEVAPIYDNPGETTCLAAAEIALTIMSLMVDRRS